MIGGAPLVGDTVGFSIPYETAAGVARERTAWARVIYSCAAQIMAVDINAGAQVVMWDLSRSEIHTIIRKRK